jgi:hypothetical protein
VTFETGKRRWRPLPRRRKGRGYLARLRKSRYRRLDLTLFRFRHQISIRETGNEHARRVNMFIRLFKTFKDNLPPSLRLCLLVSSPLILIMEVQSSVLDDVVPFIQENSGEVVRQGFPSDSKHGVEGPRVWSIR